MARPGQALVEYILVVALVGIVLLVSLAFFGDGIASRLTGVPGAVEAAAQGAPPPGQGVQPPGQGGQPPGQGGQPPGQGGQPPGQGGQPPGPGGRN